MRLKLTLILILVVLAGILLERRLPDRWHPFKPLRLTDAPTFVTGLKLQRLRARPAECLTVLVASEVAFEPLADRETGAGCGFFNAVRLLRSNVSYGGNITLQCPALVSLLLWEQHHLQPLAQSLFDTDIVNVNHFGTYACRNVNNRSTARRSQHATANAIDIAGFTLADGRQISVLDDWGNASDSSEFLHQLHAAACDYFGTVLGPDYNSLHANHFHFDMARFGICR